MSFVSLKMKRYTHARCIMIYIYQCRSNNNYFIDIAFPIIEYLLLFIKKYLIEYIFLLIIKYLIKYILKKAVLRFGYVTKTFFLVRNFIAADISLFYIFYIIFKLIFYTINVNCILTQYIQLLVFLSIKKADETYV